MVEFEVVSSVAILEVGSELQFIEPEQSKSTDPFLATGHLSREGVHFSGQMGLE